VRNAKLFVFRFGTSHEQIQTKARAFDLAVGLDPCREFPVIATNSDGFAACSQHSNVRYRRNRIGKFSTGSPDTRD
jgi:hypothetical protein